MMKSQTDFNMMEGEHNRIFFRQQHNSEHGGIRGVAHRAVIHDRCCLDINDMVDEQDGKLLFEITDNLATDCSTGLIQAKLLCCDI